MKIVELNKKLRVTLANRKPGQWVGFRFDSIKRSACIPCKSLAGSRKLFITDCCKIPKFDVVIEGLSFQPGDYELQVFLQSSATRETGDPLIYLELIRITGTKKYYCCED